MFQLLFLLRVSMFQFFQGCFPKVSQILGKCAREALVVLTCHMGFFFPSLFFLECACHFPFLRVFFEGVGKLQGGCQDQDLVLTSS